MELQIKVGLTQTLSIRKMNKLIELNITEDKNFTCLFLSKKEAKKVIDKLNELIGEDTADLKSLNNN